MRNYWDQQRVEQLEVERKVLGKVSVWSANVLSPSLLGYYCTVLYASQGEEESNEGLGLFV